MLEHVGDLVITERGTAHSPNMKLVATMALLLVCACSGNRSGFGDEDSGSDGGFNLDDEQKPNGDSAGNSGPPLIYAHSDTELYSLDPTSQAIVDIGTFKVGGAAAPTITDLAVDANGAVWVNSETAIYTAALPTTTGPVNLTLVATIATAKAQYFYALGFAPAGVLDAGETLVAGDNVGALYAIATNGSTTNLGSFGTDSSGNPYELSGDVVFYTQNSQPRGLATIRSCPSSSCTTTNDILAEIDVTAMTAAYQSKTPGNLCKQLIGSGTGYGRLFGVGAWNSSVYAFSRVSGSDPAQLIEIDSSGKGTSTQTFSQITAGWSGAGVTTKAPVTVLPN